MKVTIFTIFCGRTRYLSILMRYVRQMLDRAIIQECHLWDFTRTLQDHKYVRGLADIPSITVKPVSNKGSFDEYYRFYSRRPGSLCEDDDAIVIKCDDDVVYIDVDAVPAFLAFRDAHRDHLLCLPEIVNNGLCAHYMQQFGDAYAGTRLPLTSPHTFERRDSGFESLVSDGSKAVWLHDWFLDQHMGLEQGPKPQGGMAGLDHVLLGPTQRISINMFAMLSKDLHLLAEPGVAMDDENFLTTSLPERLGRSNSIFPALTVSHFGFGPQRATGLDGDVERRLLERYDGLATQEMCSVMTA